MNIQIKRWDNNDVIFEGEFASIKECLEKGVALGINFSYANLNYAELADAELADAELDNTKLNDANLNFANLNRANLNRAELNGAKLNNAELNNARLNHAKLNNAELKGTKLNDTKLNYAELEGAQMHGALGNTSRLFCLQYGSYRTVIVDKTICHAGCTTMTCEEWLAYSGEDLSPYNKNYLDHVTKPFIRMCLGLSELGN